MNRPPSSRLGNYLRVAGHNGGATLLITRQPATQAWPSPPLSGSGNLGLSGLLSHHALLITCAYAAYDAIHPPAIAERVASCPCSGCPAEAFSMNSDVRPMEARDLAAADQVFRLAFGTEFHLPDPTQFFGDADLIRPRWQANPRGCFVAEAGGTVIGSVAVMNWGSVAVLGPLSVHPDHWNRGVARQLLPPALNAAREQNARLVGLFTNSSSPRHLRLYESVGFTTQHLIAVMTRRVDPKAPQRPLTLLSSQANDQKPAALAACRQIAGTLFKGLDLSREIQATADQRLGDTILLRSGDAVVGFALCHHGPGSEAGTGTLAIKFGAVLPGVGPAFRDLLTAAEALAGQRAATRVQASVNHARRDAYAIMKDCGYRTEISGVAMCRPGSGGYDNPDLLLTDEWR